MLVEIKRIHGMCCLFIGSILQIMRYYRTYKYIMWITKGFVRKHNTII